MYDPDLVTETDIPASTQQALPDAAVRREALATQWPRASQVSALLGGSPRSGGDSASQLRHKGELLGVYVTCPEPSYRYPTWQFDVDGKPVEHLAEILAVLRNYGPFHRESHDLRRTTGWEEVEWLLTPHALLDGAPPAAMLVTDSARVLRAACIEFKKEI